MKLNIQQFVPDWIPNTKWTQKVKMVKPVQANSSIIGSSHNKNILLITNELKLINLGIEDTPVMSNSFLFAIRPILQIAQFFAVMPVLGLRGANVESLYFSWCCFSTIYCFVVIILTVVYTFLTLFKTAKYEVTADTIVPIIFFVNVCYAQVCFIMLARRWPSLMKKWCRVESKLPGVKSSLSIRFRVIAIILMSLSLTEHILNVLTITYEAILCNSNDPNYLRSYFLLEQSQLYEFIEYSLVRSIIFKIITLFSTFMWTFIDLILILISLGISTQFRQINQSLVQTKGQIVPENFWTEHRIIYRKLCNLTYDVDSDFAKIILLSFGNNLFFVCIKLVHCFNNQPSVQHYLYVWFSLVFLICRTLSVLLYFSQINDESKKPLRVFRNVPPAGWCAEVKRFADEVTNDQVALSGMRFFHITRKLVMSVAGTIITYELVLLQLGGDDDDDDELC